MLSFTQGEPIAAICGGPLAGKIVHLTAETEEPDRTLDQEDVTQLLDDEDLAMSRGSRRLLPAQAQRALRAALMSAQPPPEEYLVDVYRRAAGHVTERLKRELTLPAGTMFILPNRNAERVYVAGKSGSGKSCIAAMYMNEYHRMFPDRKIYLVSSHEDEKAYQSIEHEALPLEAFAEVKVAKKRGEPAVEAPMPVTLEELANSLVVFDDVDNCPSAAIDRGVKRLCNSLISNGRKYNIHTIWLNHQLTDWSKTRNLLMEANKVVFFPGGENYHATQYLKRYQSYGADTIKRILGVRSRWVMLATSNPSYVIHEHGAFII